MQIAILGVSLSPCKAGAAEKGVPLYRHISDLAGNPEAILSVPAFSVINGRSYAGNELATQKCTILPMGASGFWKPRALLQRLSQPEECHQGEIQEPCRPRGW